MSFRNTSTQQRKAGLKPCGCVVVCGGLVGIAMNQAAAHAINPRDPGGLGFM